MGTTSESCGALEGTNRNAPSTRFTSASKPHFLFTDLMDTGDQ